MSSAQILHGVIPYLPSPVDSAGEIDRPVLCRLVEHLIGQGVHGLAPLGATGEFAYLNFRRREAVVETVVEAAAGPCRQVAISDQDGSRLAGMRSWAWLRISPTSPLARSSITCAMCMV